MNTSLSWIKEYVPDLECTDQEYMDAMTLSGTKCEGYKKLDEDLDKILVGHIDLIEKHPDADKLVVCKVDIGTEVIQIVTGATNVEEGQLVPVVLHGGKIAGAHGEGLVPGGIKIKKGKLRGVESQGMMCGIDELGSSKEFFPEAPDDGIYIFKEGTVKPGDDAVEALGLHDSVFEYEITSNRVDCYSVIGIAREAAATFGKNFKAPQPPKAGDSKDVEKYISVNIEDEDLCRRFCARVVKNVKIGESPDWMKSRLRACGIRPINNLVDITNYIMEEYGQPMHAYDLSTIEDNKIVVRRAKDGEKFVTLDGEEHTLDNEMCMICDGKKAVGIGGIMGGENSMITDDVQDMLFEAACFVGPNIRLSSKRLGLRTDASNKFEKGLDPNNAEEAINRACQLIEELGVGEVVDGMVDVYPVKNEPHQIKFDPDYVNKLIGFELSKEQMLSYFDALELEYDESTDMITVPTFRQDLLEMCDIAEEITRFYGYDNIPTTLPSGEATTGKLSWKLRIDEITRNVARYCGFSQGYAYSFESPKVYDKLLLPEDAIERKSIEISNPLGEDFSVMRTTPLDGMLTSLASNYNHKNKDVRLYEMGNVYLPKELPLKELPDERMQLVLGFYGEGDFFTMKGVVEELLEQLGMTDKVAYDANTDKPFLHPGRKASINYDGKEIGYLGEVHPKVCKNYGMKTRAYIAVIDMPYVYEMANFDTKYEGIAKFPAVTRDISMVVPKEIPVGDIETVIEKKGGAILESYSLFDLYEGDQIEEGKKSVAYSIVFRAKDKTLEDAEVQESMDKILKALEEMNIQLRG